MKNLYEELHVASTATAEEIRKAYKKYAFFTHPDKGGDAEKMKDINNAYSTLINPTKRQQFDQQWKLVNEFEDIPGPVAGYLPNTENAPYSQAFKLQHKNLVKQYQHVPLISGDILGYFKSLEELEINFVPDKNYFNNSSNIIEKLVEQPLTPPNLIKMFLAFLQFNFTEVELNHLIKQLTVNIKALRNQAIVVPALNLYEGVLRFIALSTDDFDLDFSLNKQNPEDCSFLFALNKITSYAEQTFTQTIKFMVPLLQNKCFRYLVAQDLQNYWLTKDFEAFPNLKVFDGTTLIKQTIDKLKDQIITDQSLLVPIKLLNSFEKSIKRDLHLTAVEYRKYAYNILDWIPAFSENTTLTVVINTFLQAGYYFQLAAQAEVKSDVTKMADERLALRMYLFAFSLTHRTLPHIELYVGKHILKYVSFMQYKDKEIEEFIHGIQHRSLSIANIFPFFLAEQSNADFLLKNQERIILLMRQFLHSLVDAVEYNQLSDEPMSIDYKPVTILYHAYEASLKNWYEINHDGEQEKRLRLNLMYELLAENNWSFADIEENLDFSWQVGRDENGWLVPKRELSFPNSESWAKFQSLDGIQLDYKRGELNFVLTPWDSKTSYEKAFTQLDLREMISNNIEGAFFSLDPVDPDMGYHPFNVMRFAPSRLYETEFLKTLLLTDYLLKFLTMKHEVQGQFPFATRPITKLIAHLPEYLQEIIENFQSAANTESLHRFWIEAVEIPAAINEVDEETKEEAVFIAIADLKMVVKKHVMLRDVNGNLVDAEEDKEGWAFYELSARQRELIKGTQIINDPAIILTKNSNTVYFYEHGVLSDAVVIKNYQEKLEWLCQQKKDTHGQIIKNLKNEYMLYWLTTIITKQANKSHYFSPEYVFAQEFSDHYDEFAMYFPELQRLKELGRITALLRILNGVRQNNSENINKLTELLQNDTYWQIRQKEIDNKINQIQQEYQDQYKKEEIQCCAKLKQQFQEWNRDLQQNINKQRQSISDIHKQIGYVGLSYSKEYESCKQQLQQIFGNLLSSYYSKYDYDNFIDKFIRGNLDPLIQAMIYVSKENFYKQVKNALSVVQCQSINAALNNDENCLKDIAKQLNDHQFRECKKQVNEAVSKLEHVMAEEKTLIQHKITSRQNIEDRLVQANLPTTNEEVDLKGKCLWVPANIQHKIEPGKYNSIIYGGVHVEPRVKVYAQNSAKSTCLLNAVFSQNKQIVKVSNNSARAAQQLPVASGRGGGIIGGGNRGGNNRGNGNNGGSNISSGGKAVPQQARQVNITKISRQRQKVLKSQGFQDHHIISDKNKATKDHELLEKANFNLDSRANKMFLPKEEHLHPTRALHQGRHLNSVSEELATKMTNIVEKGKKENWSTAQYNQALQGLLKKERVELKAGDIVLNKNKRPWAL